MKKNYYLVLMFIITALVACNKTSFKKTKSGLLYQIFSSGETDSVIKAGSWMKINFSQEINDSVIQTTYGKMPYYQQMMPDPTAVYTPVEIFPLLKKGDSVISVQLVDSLIAKKFVTEDRLPPFLKKGDRITFRLKILDVFDSDSLYRKDVMAETEKNRVREEVELAGQKVKELKDMEEYLAAKKIPAQKTGEGTFVWIKEQGTGMQVDSGKYITVKYTGKILSTDSTFESNVYPLQLEVDPVIDGWVEGLKVFKEGGKGTLYIPGHKAYGKNVRPGSPFGPDAALIFDVELLRVADTPPPPPPMEGAPNP